MSAGVLVPDWPAPRNVHAYTTLRDAELSPSHAAPRWLKQVHGTRVVRDPVAVEEADASVTSQANVVLAIRTADCLPVLFASQDGQEIGAAHAGWRGLAAGMLEATLDAMHAPASTLVAWLGPAAGSANYEVGEEVRAAFAGHERRFAPTRPGHWLVDLYGIARDKLAARGLARVSGGQFCTIGDASKFYSHRRDGSTGRHATVIWRE